MAYAREAVIRVVRGKQANVVPLAEQLVGQSFDMPPDPARIRIRVGRDKRYAHRAYLRARASGFLSRMRPQELVQLRQLAPPRLDLLTMSDVRFLPQALVLGTGSRSDPDR